MSRRSKRGRMDPPEDDTLVIDAFGGDPRFDEEGEDVEESSPHACDSSGLLSKESPVGVKTRGMAKKRRFPKRFSPPRVEVPEETVMEPQEENFEVKKPSNPMEVDLVVNEVMKYLDPNTLKACRLVSKQWHHAATPPFRAIHPPIALSKTTKIFSFQNLMKKCDPMPFESFKLVARYTLRIERYLSTFGENIKSIQIFSWPGKRMISFPQLFELLKTMPSLERLMLVNTEFPVRAEGVPPPLNACLTNPAPITMKCLETLNFTGWFMPRVTPLMQPLDMQAQQCIVDSKNRTVEMSNWMRNWFGIFPVLNSAPHIKHLELDILRGIIVQNFLVGVSRLTKLESLSVHSVSEGDLQHLIRCSPDISMLRSMTFREVHLTNHGRILLEVLEKYAERLEHLNIRVLTTRDVRIVKFPHMKSLKTLHLDTFYTLDQFLLETPGVAEPQNPFPVLNKLVISQNVLQGMILANLKSTSVTELVVKMTPTLVNGFRNAIQDENDPEDHPLYDRRQGDAVRQIAKIFPAVKKLKVIDTRCSVIRVIFETLTQLEELEIQHSIQRYGLNATVDLNRVLTGMDHPSLHSGMLDHYGADPAVSEEKKKVALEFVHKCSPVSIRNMTNLKCLTLSGRQCIDEATVHLAFLHMQRLDRLVFSEKSMCFGNSTLDKLRQHHKMVQVIIPQPVPPHIFLDMVY